MVRHIRPLPGYWRRRLRWWWENLGRCSMKVHPYDCVFFERGMWVSWQGREVARITAIDRSCGVLYLRPVSRWLWWLLKPWVWLTTRWWGWRHGRPAVRGYLAALEKGCIRSSVEKPDA